jgi:hypothetical protein
MISDIYNINGFRDFKYYDKCFTVGCIFITQIKKEDNVIFFIPSILITALLVQFLSLLVQLYQFLEKINCNVDSIVNFDYLIDIYEKHIFDRTVSVIAKRGHASG